MVTKITTNNVTSSATYLFWDECSYMATACNEVAT